MTQTLGCCFGNCTQAAAADCGFAKQLDGSFRPLSDWLQLLRVTVGGTEVGSGVIF